MSPVRLLNCFHDGYFLVKHELLRSSPENKSQQHHIHRPHRRRHTPPPTSPSHRISPLSASACCKRRFQKEKVKGGHQQMTSADNWILCSVYYILYRVQIFLVSTEEVGRVAFSEISIIISSNVFSGCRMVESWISETMIEHKNKWKSLHEISRFTIRYMKTTNLIFLKFRQPCCQPLHSWLKGESTVIPFSFSVSKIGLSVMTKRITHTSTSIVMSHSSI